MRTWVRHIGVKLVMIHSYAPLRLTPILQVRNWGLRKVQWPQLHSYTGEAAGLKPRSGKMVKTANFVICILT